MLDDCGARRACGSVFWQRCRLLYLISTHFSSEIRAALLVPKPFAIMRCPAPSAAIALIVCVLFSSPPFVEHASAGALADSLEAHGREPAEPDSDDSSDVWLPIPEEDVEIPESLLEERHSGDSSVLVRGGITQGRFRPRRIALEGAPRGIRADLGCLVEGTGGRKIRPGARLNARGVTVAGGRVSISRVPPLLADVLGITRSGRRVPGPRSGVIAADPSLGASAGAMDGAAIALPGRVSAWSFAGIRPGSRERVAGAGLGFARRTLRLSAAAGATGRGSRVGSLTFSSRDRGRSMAAEALVCGEGRAVLAEVMSRGEEMLVTARWRFYSWTPGQVAAELSAQTLGRGPRARLTWRSWAGDASQDDGILELEASVPQAGRSRAPFRLRLGAAGLGSGLDRAARQEAYGMLDATVAQDAGRSLGIHVVRRGSSSLGQSAASTTVGTRLDVSTGRMGEHTILIESTRVRKGVVAWGVELTASGMTTLRARSKQGIWVTARGGFGRHPWRLGYALERGEDAEGPRPWSGTVWLGLRR